MILNIPIISVIAYFLGSIPFGLILTAISGGGDIRKIGSGNIGATNVLRTGKKGIAAATLLLDALKGSVAVILADYLSHPTQTIPAMACAAFIVVIGHCFPIWLGFKGGKGVATSLGAIWILAWPVGLICCAVWLLTARITRISSAGALVAFLIAPFIMLLFAPYHAFLDFPLATLCITLLVLVRHTSNIKRLIHGEEPQIKS
ncbi:glycerol-3-phosphate 1-O-acyltransferase PlsY [Swingsia samuiensis]|uniref:Glycerol-3-phosphate acyltransferase n=1 Tax=Swingsia samuiensis TaxID=1293412 RepID=A0A4Y6UJT0_9PROT|nr:glycerol-3-phosphate 1-O-acyltransferase PlsY [Swingsia samuiensis]QDH16736.1 glycerol-3-phosphate 1-O-acyltransferase PlsY [Swingsia samuiensis]